MSVRQPAETQQYKWVGVLRDNFGTKLDSVESERWMQTLNQKYNTSDERICSAIVWASDSRNWHRKDTQLRVTIPELQQWIRMCNRRTAEEGARSVCSACDGNGWVPYARNLPATGFSFRDYGMEITSAIPCACSTGRMVLRKVYPDVDDARQMVSARKAVRQRMEINAMAI